MIHLQIIGKDEARLQPLLRAAIKARRIKSFTVVQVQGGLKIQHKLYVGSIKFTQKKAILFATLRCQNQGKQWQLLESFIGRMTYHFQDKMSAINIQFI